jgi:hypothetical protein
MRIVDFGGDEVGRADDGPSLLIDLCGVATSQLDDPLGVLTVIVAEQVSWEMEFCECFEWNNASWMVVAWPHGFQPGVEREFQLSSNASFSSTPTSTPYASLQKILLDFILLLARTRSS